MINPFQDFTKKKIGGLLLIFVIIVAFGFGGFGGGFSTGNQNNIAKINNINISTQDFMDYLNKSGLSQQLIKENINKNVIEELLSSLISMTLLDLEIKDLNLVLSKEMLAERLKKNKNFQDEDGKFQRTLYEKFLLTNNMSAAMYEMKLKSNALQKELFTYISGGAKSPNFLVHSFFKENNRKLDISFINLNKFYKKVNEFTDQDMNLFMKKNSEKLKQDYIDFSYVILTPKNLIGLDEFNQAFFDSIDEIENKISKDINFKTIINELAIKPIIKRNYINLENKKTIENTIYNSRKDKIEILEDNGAFIFYHIDDIKSKLPDLKDDQFAKQIKKLIFQEKKFEFNKSILDQIDKKKFNDEYFNKLANGKIEKIQLNSIKDVNKFKNNSVEILYSLPINTFTMIADNEDNIFVAKVIRYEDISIDQNSKKFNAISNEASAENRNSILKSYDFLLNSKYKVIVNEKTLDRVKNYFR
ncbi:peptidyl-prolyl cis-trans isomerase D [Candidatus Pelagibacter ubique]|uniref:Peptidyl-prolyl cis-trans isomerase D n=1 Tax=Pelagibacter ubique TaxID=198252 RepID=A0ABX1T3Q9_PELUQ|nr:SurA N-terminal domain-containing protein [Candidatus Pelagibacter ubique]NMN68079.1 peptidyl-prolyl cis-trans isomerase D [Candidatus Pelagibacter ubique]